MKFCWVTLPVKNLKNALAFYHDLLGLAVNSQHSGNGMEMAMLGDDGMPKIELIYLPGNEEKSFSADITVGVAVDSLEQARELLEKNGVSILRGPVSPAPGTRFLFVADPDGYEVQLVESQQA